MKVATEMDKYDLEILELLSKPENEVGAEIRQHWYRASPLFQFVNSTGQASGDGCGCLTMIKAGRGAETEELTLAIRSDDRIPSKLEDITIESLPVFAEWQRCIDKELGRNQK